MRIRSKVEFPYIYFMHKLRRKILTQTFAGQFVELHKASMRKSCLFKPLGQTATSGK